MTPDPFAHFLEAFGVDNGGGTAGREPDATRPGGRNPMFILLGLGTASWGGCNARVGQTWLQNVGPLRVRGGRKMANWRHWWVTWSNPDPASGDVVSQRWRVRCNLVMQKYHLWTVAVLLMWYSSRRGYWVSGLVCICLCRAALLRQPAQRRLVHGGLWVPMLTLYVAERIIRVEMMSSAFLDSVGVCLLVISPALFRAADRDHSAGR